VTALQVNLATGEQARVWAKGTTNLEAYLKFMQARESMLKGMRRAMSGPGSWRRKPLALDPQYAVAYMFTGATHINEFLIGSGKSPGIP